MRTRKLGPLDVTVVGLGCNNFGGRIGEEATRAVVDAALQTGVTFFDTADIYGNKGGSEELLGPGLISYEAPLGRALLGKQEGDTVRVRRPAGEVEYTVVKVEWK